MLTLTQSRTYPKRPPVSGLCVDHYYSKREIFSEVDVASQKLGVTMCAIPGFIVGWLLFWVVVFLIPPMGFGTLNTQLLLAIGRMTGRYLRVSGTPSWRLTHKYTGNPIISWN